MCREEGEREKEELQGSRLGMASVGSNDSRTWASICICSHPHHLVTKGFILCQICAPPEINCEPDNRHNPAFLALRS